MLEGLEICELSLSDISFDNLNLRIDSEYFKKQYLSFFETVENLEPLGSFVDEGYRVIYENTQVVDKFEAILKDYPVFLQAADLRTPFVNTDDLFHVHENDWIRYPKGRVKHGELLIEVKGKIEKVALVPDDFPEKALVTGSLYKISVNEKINKYYLLTYLICKYGVAFKERYKTNLLISFISKDDLYRIPVPQLTMSFQNSIEGLFQKIFSDEKKSMIVYRQAETLLLETLGMADFTPSSEAVNIKSFEDSFAVSGRLDAEYYQPKYDYLEDVFNQFSRVRLADLVNHPICSGTTPKANGDDYTDAENGVPFVRAVDLQSGQVSLDNLNYIKPEIHNSVLKRTQLMKNDFLFSIAGTVGRCSVFEHDIAANINQAVAILRFDDALINRYCLMVFFNSSIGKELVEKHARQGVQTNLNLTELGDLSVPILDMTIQRQIADLVQQSFALKAHSTHLLEVAKRAVEMAIEQDELTALNYIECETHFEN